MSKQKSRKQPILGDFTFNRINPYGGDSAAPKAETARLHIDSIMPDPEQPRNLLPLDLYERLFSGQQRPVQVVNAWIQRAQAEGAEPALLESVSKVRQLSATIEHRDLINPITVREPAEADQTLPLGVKYIIVTGERRWWSHVLLTAEDRPIAGSQHPDRIKATIVPMQNIRALQLIENVAREDLSVIEKAQGMIALRDELTETSGQSVKWTDVEEILGISRSYRSRILKVLKLSDEAQDLVIRYNLTEKTIRPITEHLQENKSAQIEVLNQIIMWQSAEGEAVSSKRVANFVAMLSSPDEKRPKKRPAPDSKRWLSKFQQRLTSTIQVMSDLDSKQMQEAADAIKSGNNLDRNQLLELREKIDQLLADSS